MNPLHEPGRPSAHALTRLAALQAMLRSFGSVCIGYSGGVDSVFLAITAMDTLGADRVLAVTGISDALPSEQRRVVREYATAYGLPHRELRTDEVDDPRYAANPANRCYYCKTELWAKLADVARGCGLAVVIDGANADDATDYRPGAVAAREHAVRSPMLDVGLTKADIRSLSRQRGLSAWDRPASPCLSSRLPYGVAVTRERLAQIDAAEEWMRRAGFREFRVRHHGDAARVEVAAVETVRALAMTEAMYGALRSLGFAHVLLDVEGYRRGALNEALLPVRIGRRAARGPAAGPLAVPGGQGSAEVRPAGQRGEIACVRAAPERFAQLADLAPGIRARGFRYIALDLAPPEGSDD